MTNIHELIEKLTPNELLQAREYGINMAGDTIYTMCSQTPDEKKLAFGLAALRYCGAQLLASYSFNANQHRPGDGASSLLESEKLTSEMYVEQITAVGSGDIQFMPAGSAVSSGPVSCGDGSSNVVPLKGKKDNGLH